MKSNIEVVKGYLNALKEKKSCFFDYVATIWDADTSFGVIPIFECFRVADEEIKEIKAYVDPRPITNPSQ